jgi:cytochrome c peroxidase
MNRRTILDSSATLACVAALLVASGCQHGDEGDAEGRAAHAGAAEPAAVPAAPFAMPAGLAGVDLIVPEDNPLTTGRIRLGEQLFFDTRLSADRDMSCESCHVPERGWTDGKELSAKFDETLNTRHSPTLYGAGVYPKLYWDGRAPGLEAQILAAWKGQMGADPAAIATDLAGVPAYRAQFEKEFGGEPTGERIVQALAGFVRTLHAGDTPWDRHPQDAAGLAASEVGRGFTVFTEVAQCSLCHAPPFFSDLDFHNVGIGSGAATPDGGRGGHLAATAEKAGQPVPEEAAAFMGAFKTPSLRGVALTAPYFHDGKTATLEEAVDLMLAGGVPNATLDPKLKPVKLTEVQRLELLAFLRALTPEERPYTRPLLP